jgi:hypothetical protein
VAVASLSGGSSGISLFASDEGADIEGGRTGLGVATWRASLLAGAGRGLTLTGFEEGVWPAGPRLDDGTQSGKSTAVETIAAMPAIVSLNSREKTLLGTPVRAIGRERTCRAAGFGGATRHFGQPCGSGVPSLRNPHLGQYTLPPSSFQQEF